MSALQCCAIPVPAFLHFPLSQTDDAEVGRPPLTCASTVRSGASLPARLRRMRSEGHIRCESSGLGCADLGITRYALGSGPSSHATGGNGRWAEVSFKHFAADIRRLTPRY